MVREEHCHYESSSCEVVHTPRVLWTMPKQERFGDHSIQKTVQKSSSVPKSLSPIAGQPLAYAIGNPLR
jgi:hypothetical protein